MLGRAGDVHGHDTRSARSGIYLSSRDHRTVGYRVPKEWAALSEQQRGLATLGAFKRGSKRGILGEYAAFVCRAHGCVVCREGD